MIDVVAGISAWPTLHDRYLGGSERKHAAIAYIGKRANEWLNLGPGDTLVFDGDDNNIKQNHIDLDVIGKLMDLGVVLYVRSGLHAKVMVVESSKPVAIVGSANASVTSVEKKAEAVMVTDQQSAVDDVRLAITTWHAGLKRLDAEWLARVRALPRDRRSAPSEYEPIERGSLIDPERPMWLLQWQRAAIDYSEEAQDAASTEVEMRGVVVEPFPLGRKRRLFDRIEIGDSVLFVPYSANSTSDWPNLRMTVDEPGLVVGKVERGRYLLVATPPNGWYVTWGSVEAALDEYELDWSGDQLDASGKAAVLELFSGE